MHVFYKYRYLDLFCASFNYQKLCNKPVSIASLVLHAQNATYDIFEAVRDSEKVMEADRGNMECKKRKNLVKHISTNKAVNPQLLGNCQQVLTLLDWPVI